MLLLTTTILQCPSERSNELISLRSNWQVLSNYILVLLRCASTTLPIRYASWAKHSHEAEVMGLLAIGDWLWAIGYWVLVIGYWIWAAKPHIRASTLYTLRFTPKATATTPLHPTLYTISASAPASNLSPLAISPHVPAFWQRFDADAKGRCKSGTK